MELGDVARLKTRIKITYNSINAKALIQFKIKGKEDYIIISRKSYIHSSTYISIKI
jgi:hypothetical protein